MIGHNWETAQLPHTNRFWCVLTSDLENELGYTFSIKFICKIILTVDEPSEGETGQIRKYKKNKVTFTFQKDSSTR